jgi:hypothetical protein
MSKENLQKIVISVPCRNLEEEIILNQKVFDFNRENESNAIAGTKELDTGLPYVLEVLIETNSASAFISYLGKAIPEAQIQ